MVGLVFVSVTSVSATASLALTGFSALGLGALNPGAGSDSTSLAGASAFTPAGSSDPFFGFFPAVGSSSDDGADDATGSSEAVFGAFSFYPKCL